jgi:hypothetical protein
LFFYKDNIIRVNIVMPIKHVYVQYAAEAYLHLHASAHQTPHTNMKYRLGDLRYCQPCCCSGDSEGYCFQQVDAKLSEIGAQAFLQLLLPPSSWRPHSVIWTEYKNLARDEKGGRI